MSNGIVMIAARLWGQLFPERQVYLRSQGRVRYVSLSPGTQMAGMAIFLLIFSWMTFASVNFAFHHGALVGRDAQFDALRASNERLLLEIAQGEQRFLNKAMLSDAKQQQLAELLVQTDRVEVRADAEVQVPENASTTSSYSGMQPRPRPDALPAEIRTEVTVLSDVSPRPRPSRPLFMLPSNMTTVGGGVRNGQAMSQTALVAPGLSGTKSGQYDVVAFLAADAGTTIVALEKLINQTGLDADTMLRRNDGMSNPVGSHAEGGPLLKLPPSMNGKFLRRNLSGELSMPSTRKGRLEMLREALFSLPLAEPVDKYYISSAYGYRRDPFTRARAFHSGMDLVAAHGDPVLSSAPGTVVFAGRNGPYGNMVEIDHGRGVKSRYGHLSKVGVVRGQKVGLRDLIGLVGNTGRSGTAHLHFEVWFDGKARDPRNFLKAGENVFQRQG